MASLFTGGREGGCGKEKEVILTMMNHECPGSPRQPGMLVRTGVLPVCWCKYTEI